MKYPILWEPKEACVGKGCSQKLVETHLRVCSTSKSSFCFSLTLFCLNMLLFNMPVGSLGTEFCEFSQDSRPLTHSVVVEIGGHSLPCVKQRGLTGLGGEISVYV